MADEITPTTPILYPVLPDDPVVRSHERDVRSVQNYRMVCITQIKTELRQEQDMHQKLYKGYKCVISSIETLTTILNAVAVTSSEGGIDHIATGVDGSVGTSLMDLAVAG